MFIVETRPQKTSFTNKNTDDRPVAPKLGIFDIFFPIPYDNFYLP